MGKDISQNRSGNADSCSWNIDDALRSLQDADKKIREFLEREKKIEKGKGTSPTKQEPEPPAS